MREHREMGVPATSATALLTSCKLVVHQAAEMFWGRGGEGEGRLLINYAMYKVALTKNGRRAATKVVKTR